ncbi:MAG: hypothetical protein K2I03_08185 [Lachnospiraceae bacterium]|nr:hypothetical protein [Lachnospiraceae bacterium]
MKIRTDFVTNSSSSSFIIARKEELTDKQKEAVIDYVVNNMLGEKVPGNKDDIDKMLEEMYIDEDYKEDICKAMENGLSIYQGYVSFEEPDEIGYLMEGLWKALEEADGNNFVGIDTDLEY